MKFGVFTVGLPEYTPEEGVKLLKELGYDGVEWRIAEIPKEKPQNVPYERRYWGDNKCTIDVNTVEQQAEYLKQLGEEYDIECFALASYLRPSDTEKIESVMRAAKIVGAPKIRIFQEGYTSSDDQMNYRLALAKCRMELQALEPMCRKYGVKMILEMHHNTLISSPSAAYNVLCGLDPKCFGINIDPGNMVYEGFENYQKAFELLGEFIDHVHVKNAIRKEAGRDEYGSKTFENVWAPLWDGSADLRELFRVLKKFGYDGTVSVEDFTNEQPTKEKLASDLEYMKKLVASV